MTRTYESKTDGWVTRVRVVEQERYDTGPFVFGGTFAEVRESLEAIWSSIPEPYRAAATCEISSVNSYESSSYATIEIEYPRPATLEEIAAVVAEQEARTAQKQREERAAYAALRAKYGDQA